VGIGIAPHSLQVSVPAESSVLADDAIFTDVWFARMLEDDDVPRADAHAPAAARSSEIKGRPLTGIACRRLASIFAGVGPQPFELFDKNIKSKQKKTNRSCVAID
jgi:hypothetical protein